MLIASFWKSVFPSFAAVVVRRVQIWHQVTVVIVDQPLVLCWELLIFGATLSSFDKSHFLSPHVITACTVATLSLPAPPVSPNASAAATTPIYKLWEISTVWYCAVSLWTVRRCQSHAPSLQLTCLHTCSALQQTYLTFNSNYTFIVTKPQSLDIVAQFLLQKTLNMCRAALSLRPYVTWEKELAWEQELWYTCLLNEPETVACFPHQNC